MAVLRDLRRLRSLLARAAPHGGSRGEEEARERVREAWGGYLWGALLPAARRMDEEFATPFLREELRKAGVLDEARVVIEAIEASRQDFFRAGQALDRALQAGDWPQARALCDDLVGLAEEGIGERELEWVPLLLGSFVPGEAQERFKQEVTRGLGLATTLMLFSSYEELARAENLRAFEEEHPFWLRSSAGQLRRSMFEPTGAPFLDESLPIRDAREALKNSGASPISALDSVLGLGAIRT
mmetsp:Transcript_34201/g.101588  ORF Transcript_34201/g.101588 Transcript_34201/m.101588 type:complete len:242 (+) Transcript_34201:2-727(+)